MAFFNKHLAGLAAEAGVVIIAPQTLTISDFFSKASAGTVADRITLLVSLYDCYKELYPKAEPLDDFIFWGDVLLGDFNDVDKYLADPAQLYTNVADLRNMQDDFSYLTDNQREAITKFISHFKGGDSREGDVKATFMQIWNILLPLYRSFRKKLSDSGLAYEGMVYRELAERIRKEPVSDILKAVFPNTDRFIFVGLNALNECEKTVMLKMKEASIAEFCWDFCSDMIRHPLNKSSHFMNDNVRMFPQAFRLEPVRKDPSFKVISVPSATGQVKQVPEILRETGINGSNSDDCAIVLADETLLMPLLNSIPPEIESINVTMGYPLIAGEFYSLMRDITRMQIHLRIKKDKSIFFYHKQVWNIISSGLFKRLIDEDEEVKEIIKNIKKSLRYYICAEDLKCGNGSDAAKILNCIFKPVVTDLSRADAGLVRNFADYQMEIISLIAPILAKDPSMVLEVDFAKEYYRCIKSLRGKKLEVTAQTYAHLLESLLSGVSVPFRGEPLKGLQVMGPLETRALDFRNVIILSCNEGVFPRKNVSSSFIPPQLRKGFGLPTYEYQDAVWAYYFYRLISRAENVWMVFDSRTEGVKSGEESRYIKQLRYHFNKPVEDMVAKNPIEASSNESDDIIKTEEDIRTIREKYLSPSTLQKYLDCPAQFYYHTVKGLRKDDEVAETMDASMIGEVYHNTMRALLMGEDEMNSDASFDKRDNNRTKGLEKVSTEYLESWLKREKDIRRKVYSLICAELKSDEVSGRDLVTAEVITRYVLMTIKRDIEILKERRCNAFIIEGLELPIHAKISGLKFFGVIDRLDRLDGVLRVSDYKSGKDDPKSLLATADSADKVFEGKIDERHKKKALLQFYIYNRMLEEMGYAEQMTDSMYAVSSMFKDPVGIVSFPEEFNSAMQEHLDSLISEILNIEIPFSKADDEESCKWCDFKMICGK